MEKNNSTLLFDFQKALEQDQIIERKIDEKISVYMQEKNDFSKMKEEIIQELKFSIMRDLRPEIYKIVRDCFREIPLNIKII